MTSRYRLLTLAASILLLAGTVIRFEIPSTLADAKARLAIYNLRGELVAELLHQRLPAGNYFVRWEGKNETHEGVTSGVYFYRLQVGPVKEARKLTLLR